MNKNGKAHAFNTEFQSEGGQEYRSQPMKTIRKGGSLCWKPGRSKQRSGEGGRGQITKTLLGYNKDSELYPMGNESH